MAEMIWNAAVSVYNFIMDNIVLINIFLALVIVFFQRRSPQTVWTWLLLLYFIPILGFVMYLIIGHMQSGGRRRRFIINGFAWRIRRCQGLKI